LLGWKALSARHRRALLVAVPASIDIDVPTASVAIGLWDYKT
jgi:hypothetical protein